MALNWKSAQKNEKKFWEDIYLNNDSKDLIYRKTSIEGWVNFAKIVLKRHNLSINYFKNKNILDVGSGPGGVVAGLYELIDHDKNCRFTCIDPLMDFFKKEIGILNEKSNLTLINCSGENLKIKNQSLDIIFCSNVLDHCQNVDKVISEVYRVLKPGGLFLPSLHLVYNKFFIIKNLLKYVDKNHPHHFIEKDIIIKLNKYFSKIQVSARIKIQEDQPDFSFKNILKNKSKFRGLKRFLANYILYTCYLSCQK